MPDRHSSILNELDFFPVLLLGIFQRIFHIFPDISVKENKKSASITAPNNTRALTEVNIVIIVNSLFKDFFLFFLRITPPDVDTLFIMYISYNVYFIISYLIGRINNNKGVPLQDPVVRSVKRKKPQRRSISGVLICCGKLYYFLQSDTIITLLSLQFLLFHRHLPLPLLLQKELLRHRKYC